MGATAGRWGPTAAAAASFATFIVISWYAKFQLGKPNAGCRMGATAARWGPLRPLKPENPENPKSLPCPPPQTEVMCATLTAQISCVSRTRRPMQPPPALAKQWWPPAAGDACSKPFGRPSVAGLPTVPGVTKHNLQQCHGRCAAHQPRKIYNPVA